MDQNERLSFFYELIRSKYDIYTWRYDSSFTLLESSLEEIDLIAIMDYRKNLEEHMQKSAPAPLILEVGLGLEWLAAFHWDGQSVTEIHIIGSFLNGRDTSAVLLKKLDTYNLSVKTRALIRNVISTTPVIPGNVLMHYAIMFHYTLNREKIDPAAVRHSLRSKRENVQAYEESGSEHGGVWMSEQVLCRMFEEGNPDYKKALANSSVVSSGIKADVGDPVRMQKNGLFVLMTLCSRSCIKGGLNPSVGYNLFDYYAKEIEGCKTIGELSALSEEMLSEYVSRTAKAKRDSHISPQVQNICFYIKQNIAEDLTIESLARRMGYSDYYFSHKFKQEVGVSVRDYILQEKIAQAKLLLAGTNRSIQDISDTLAFSNRSHFFSCFKKAEGLSPTEYRKQNAKPS